MGQFLSGCGTQPLKFVKRGYIIFVVRWHTNGAGTDKYAWGKAKVVASRKVHGEIVRPTGGTKFIRVAPPPPSMSDDEVQVLLPPTLVFLYRCTGSQKNLSANPRTLGVLCPLLVAEGQGAHPRISSHVCARRRTPYCTECARRANINNILTSKLFSGSEFFFCQTPF